MQNENTESAQTAQTVSILSIDAWNGPDGWNWNNWYKIGTIDRDTLDRLDSDEKILEWLISEGYLRAGISLDREVEIDDDQYNLVICDRAVIDAPGDCDGDHRCEHTHQAMPILAIAYGELQ